MARYPSKNPNNIEPFFVVWCDATGINTGAAADNGELQGATIVTSTWTVPAGITKASDNTLSVTIHGVTYPVNTVATIWLSGGTNNTDYELTNKITTSDLRTLTAVITVPVY